MMGKESMPVWISDNKIDPSWINDNIHSHDGHVSECVVKDISNDTRKGDVVRNGATLLLQLTCQHDDKDDTTMTLVAKQVPQSGLTSSRQLGLARESIFYNKLSSKIQLSSTLISCIPEIYYSYGDIESGSKVVIMEDLSSNYIDSGVLFGNGNPNNWKRDLESIVKKAYPQNNVPSAYDVANLTFQAIAHVHAKFWRDKSLLEDEYNYLRCSSWINGKDEKSWRASQGMIQGIWEKYNSAVERSNGIQWDPLVRQLVDKAMEGISWESQQERLNSNSNFTLVHGDFWPGNVMISTGSNTNENRYDIRLLDWEMCGLGSGPQDLGQYILSNMDPALRRECEERLIKNYYQKLVSLGVSDFSWDECWTEYKIGGLERWLWFLVYFSCLEGEMIKWAQFFHDQIREFVHDHKICQADITQPRP